jgi:predicted DNA-binding transcriptional regulator YafY
MEIRSPMVAMQTKAGRSDTLRTLVRRAMQQSDELVLVFDYIDAKGWGTRRVASPIRFLGSDRFLALCLSREEPRHFAMGRCRNPRLEPASDFLMPVPLVATP